MEQNSFIKKKYCFQYGVVLFILLSVLALNAQPNWPLIKANATFNIPDTNYFSPQILPINVGGWEDGLYITRDGKHLFSTYLPVDALSWVGDLSPCINFHPYYRGPLLGIDTITNPWSCQNYMQSDIIKTERPDTGAAFNQWHYSNLNKPATFEGGVCGVLLNADTFDVFVCTRDTGATSTDIMFMRNVPVNPGFSTAVPILSTTAQEDNPHIERLTNGNLLLFFDRDRYIYYSTSTNNGISWQTPTLVTNVLNDQAPYDVQPHLWHDGLDWWVYFCADNPGGLRCIYRSKQITSGNWNSWGTKEMVVEPIGISGAYGNVIAVGEPTLTEWGDLYFVTVYGNTLQPDTTDVFDCDPWVLKRKHPLINSANNQHSVVKQIELYPNPANTKIIIETSKSNANGTIYISNINGQELIKLQATSCKLQVDISNLPSGIYFVKVVTDKTVEVGKIIKE
ncbi:MAG: T9SS type A sorting domain-containing protein [Bacteroidales bacterium]|nr:T9SS type A sorting domain-containing protein [Bacteroidales bacterium]